MISFYKIRVGYPERCVFHPITNKVVRWEHKYKTDITPTENLPMLYKK